MKSWVPSVSVSVSVYLFVIRGTRERRRKKNLYIYSYLTTISITKKERRLQKALRDTLRQAVFSELVLIAANVPIRLQDEL